MMKSKIRELLSKLSFKKKKDNPESGEFYDDFYEDEIQSEEESDLPIEEEHDFDDEEEIQLETPEDDTPPLPSIPTAESDETPDIALPEDDQEIEEEEEGTSEFVMAQNSDEDYDNTDFTDTTSIDLENGKVSFSDKVDHFKTRVSDVFRRFNKKQKQTLTRESFENLDAVDNDEEEKSAPLLKAKSKAKNLIKGSGLSSKVSSFNWQELLKNAFKTSTLSTYHKAFQQVIIILVVLFLGKTIGLILKGKPDYSHTAGTAQLNVNYDRVLKPQLISQIKSANLFRTDKVKKTKNTQKRRVETTQICDSASRKSSLPIKLVNSIVLQDSVKSLASVQIRSSKKFESFREGDKIKNMAKIDKIEGHRLIIKNLKSGNCESIESKGRKFRKKNPIAVLSPKRSRTFKRQLKKIDGIKNDGNSFKIKKSFLQKKVADISTLLTQARGIQINNPDGTISFKIVDIEPGGIFAYLGIENGDIISGINGDSITNLNQVMTLFGNVSNLKKMNLTISRSGQEVEQDYEVE